MCYGIFFSKQHNAFCIYSRPIDRMRIISHALIFFPSVVSRNSYFHVHMHKGERGMERECESRRQKETCITAKKREKEKERERQREKTASGVLSCNGREHLEAITRARPCDVTVRYGFEKIFVRASEREEVGLCTRARVHTRACLHACTATCVRARARAAGSQNVHYNAFGCASLARSLHSPAISRFTGK